jgi:glutaredoxin 3
VTVTIYTKSGCPWCDRAKAWFADRSIPFEQIAVEDPSERRALYDRLELEGGSRTMPQVFVGESRIGGYSDLMAREMEVLELLAE